MPHYVLLSEFVECISALAPPVGLLYFVNPWPRNRTEQYSTVTNAFLPLSFSLLLCRFGHFRVYRSRFNVQDIVASDQNLSQETGELSVNKFFRSVQQQIHVGITTTQGALIFHSPLEFDTDCFARQVGQEGFWIDNELRLRAEKSKSRIS